MTAPITKKNYLVRKVTEIPEVVIPTPPDTGEVDVEPTPEPEPTATPSPEPTASPTPRPTATPATSDFFVQVLASSRERTVEEARSKLEGLDFPRDHQRVIRVQNPGSTTLFKLQVGPFPDRASAERVSQRMSGRLPKLLGGSAVSFGGRVPGPALPAWIRSRKLQLGELHEIKTQMRSGGLHTVCEEARCPNRSECF